MDQWPTLHGPVILRLIPWRLFGEEMYVRRTEDIDSVRHSVLPIKSKKINNDQELIQSDPTSCPQNQKGNN